VLRPVLEPKNTNPPLPPHPYHLPLTTESPGDFVSRNHFRLSENTHGNAVKLAEDEERVSAGLRTVSVFGFISFSNIVLRHRK